MLMQAEPVYQAYEAIAEKVKKKPRVVYPVSYTHLDVYKRQNMYKADASVSVNS